MNDWSVFGNLDCNSCPISQKYEFSALVMPLASENVTLSLIIIFIRLPCFFFYYLLWALVASTDCKQTMLYFSKIPASGERLL